MLLCNVGYLLESRQRYNPSIQPVPDLPILVGSA